MSSNITEGKVKKSGLNKKINLAERPKDPPAMRINAMEQIKFVYLAKILLLDELTKKEKVYKYATFSTEEKAREFIEKNGESMATALILPLVLDHPTVFESFYIH